jgi:hypothetical protein
MQEHGVSKIVSVKFHKVDETTTVTATAPSVKAENSSEAEISN